MAYAFDTAARPGIIDTLAGIFAGIGRTVRVQREFRRTYDELNRLTNTELLDLGIDRADITRIAFEAAHGPHR